MKKRNFLTVLALIIMSLALLTVAVGAEGSDAAEQGSKMYATFWALVPPIIAIALALITKEVYMSLFVGILAGALFATNFDPLDSISSISNNIIANAGDSWNMGILVFLVILGIIVSLMTKAGGSAAYGRWAAKKIKSKTGAMLATSALGVLIFVDDYFNCLTVGSVMRPVTDKHGVSRAKLSYIIDATAAPICIIAPISSWAAAVAGYTQTENTSGFTTFIKTIPYNFYAILTIVMLVAIAIMKVDFGSMKIHEDNAAKGDLYTTPDRPYASHDADEISSKGTVLDLILPVIVLIVCCILGMAYAGGVLDGVGFIDALGGDAATGLVIGSLVALIFTFLFYIPRRVITFRQFADSIPEGFKAMVPAIIILVFAWTLGGYCRNDLGAGEFVGNLVGDSTFAQGLIPAIMFLVAVGLAFSTGTSWGTFGILVPIILGIFITPETPDLTQLGIISISACLAGAVCGDHISPISDTTIMASTGAQCNHINHVSTQIPYAMLVAGVSFVGYLLSAFIRSAVILLPICIVLLIAVLFVIKGYYARKKNV